VFANQLKSTISRVSTSPIIARNGIKVDALFGFYAVAARIVVSPEIMGVMNTVLKELSKQMGLKYKRG